MPHVENQVWIVVPAYNEERSIADVIQSLKALGHKIVVIDDGSQDSTTQHAARAGACVLRHLINLGQGAALQTGLHFALQHGAEKIVTFDADGQHQASDIAKLLSALTNDVDFALGSRFLDIEPEGIPSSRRFVLKVARVFTQLLTGMQITDSHNGLRAMTRRGAEHIRLRQNRMAHASEILHQIARSRLRYIEVPVSIRYSSYSLAKGQRSSEALSILIDLITGALRR